MNPPMSQQPTHSPRGSSIELSPRHRLAAREEWEPWPSDAHGPSPATARAGWVEGQPLSGDGLRAYAHDKLWTWPSRRVNFVCDLHADVDAFVRSLVATGGVVRTGEGPCDFTLTDSGRESTFVIGGDCLDKGPRNLPLVRAVGHLMLELDADVVLLAGNHDMRTRVGLALAESQTAREGHLFARMGRKALTLLREVYREQVAGGDVERLSDAEARERLFPPPNWWDEFPAIGAKWMTARRLERELRRIREKMADIENRWCVDGLDFGHLHAAVEAAREMFLAPGGELAWFFERMQLAWRAGSYLFIHAGVDDALALQLSEDGVSATNAAFERRCEEDLFAVYHGSYGNGFRTKYRAKDRPLSELGVRALHDAGVYAIVHGHRNLLHGQRLVIRHGMLNLECDASLDCLTRRKEGLDGPGEAATIFRADGVVLGLSADYPATRVFDPATVCGVMTLHGWHTSRL